MLNASDQPAGRWRPRLRKFALILLLAALAGTTLVQDGLKLLLSYLLILTVVLVPVALWRRRLGWPEIGGILALSAGLFAALLQFVFFAPMHCARPAGHPYALELHRVGPLAPRHQGQLQQDADGISLSFSSKARPEAGFAPVELIEAGDLRPAAPLQAEDLHRLPLFVADGYWVASAQSAAQVAASGELTVWRVPVFHRQGDEFLAAGELSGRLRLPAATRARAKRYRMLPQMAGGMNSADQREISRYRHEALIDRVLESGRPARPLEPYRAIHEACRPDWMLKP